MQNAISRRSFIAAIPLAIGALTMLGGCGEDSNATPLDLTGTWASMDDTGEVNMTAVIEGDEITIYWGDDTSNIFSVFWAGSYEAPNKSTNTWSWKSKKDADRYGIALAASDADTIEFKYKNDVITFEASLYGLTQTAELQRISGGYHVSVIEEDGYMTISWTVNGIESSKRLQVSDALNSSLGYRALIMGWVAESTIFIVKEGRALEADEYGNTDYAHLNFHGSDYGGTSQYTWTVDGIETSIEFPSNSDYSEIITMVIDATLKTLRQEGEI